MVTPVWRLSPGATPENKRVQPLSRRLVPEPSCASERVQLYLAGTFQPYTLDQAPYPPGR